AAELVSTPLLRNMGTLGGNLCLDTRCNYYNQSYEWRKAIDFCMKKDGHICWVAPSSPRCWAVSSSDVAPVMVAVGADYVLVGPGGERVVPAARFYHNDGINYLTKQPDEVLAAVRLPAPDGWDRSEEHTSELQSPCNIVCRLLLEKKKITFNYLSCEHKCSFILLVFLSLNYSSQFVCPTAPHYSDVSSH